MLSDLLYLARRQVVRLTVPSTQACCPTYIGDDTYKNVHI